MENNTVLEIKRMSLLEKSIYSLGLLMAVFNIWALIFCPLPARIFLSANLFFILTLVYLRYPMTSKNGRYIKKMTPDNFIFLLLSIAATVYAFIELDNMAMRAGVLATKLDIIFSLICIIVVLEAARRTTGPALPIIAVTFLLYAKFGYLIPGMLGNSGYSTKRILAASYDYSGVFGTALTTVATYVVIFMIFAAFLEKTGVGSAFLNLAMSTAGHLRGGPAKVAVIASALFGSISGSAVANVASTGSFTIPLMKKTGYSPKFAAAVEACASTGGQIMPPVMAAGAFLMAEYLGVSYLYIAKAALLPAIIYFAICWISIDCEAGRIGLAGVSRKELPRLSDVLKKGWFQFLPILLLIFLLTGPKLSAISCAFYSMLASVLIGMFQKENRMKPVEILHALAESSKGVVSIAAACACAGIVIATIGLTGLGMKICILIIGASGESTLIALIFTMVCAIIFGMGLPTTVSYILCVSVLAPVLIQMGITAIAAHLFIFYYACLSGITPPVALAAYTGAGIADSRPIPTAFTATKLASVTYFLPYMFAYNSAFLLMGSPISIAQAVFAGLLTCYALAGCLFGFLVIRLNIMLRILLGIAGAFLIMQNTTTDIIGFVMFAGIFLFLLYLRTKEKAKSSAL